jgi:prepilin-type N-terminal cleavage/methylation domain-containing protein
MSTAGSNQRGFTLVELLIVMTIAGLSLSLVATAFSRIVGASQDKQWVEKTLRELNRVRVKAVLSGKTQHVELDFATGSLRRRDGMLQTELLSLPENYAFERQATERPAGDGAEENLQILYYPDGSATESRFDILMPGKGRAAVRVRGLTGQAEPFSAVPAS